MKWRDMSIEQKKSAIRRLRSEGLSVLLISKRVGTTEFGVRSFCQRNKIELPRLVNKSNTVAQTHGMSPVWWMDADSKQYREFITEQDNKFQERMKELGYGSVV